MAIASTSTDQTLDLSKKILKPGELKKWNKNSYDLAWRKFYRDFIEGFKTDKDKYGFIPTELRRLALNIRVIWKNEHYLPTAFPPLLEACIFNIENENLVDVSAEMLMDYVNSADETTLKNDANDSEAKLDVLERLCPGITNEISNKSVDRSAYEKAVRIIMYRNTAEIRAIWTRILCPLGVGIEHFRFLMKGTVQNLPRSDLLEKTLRVHEDILPHNRWQSFFFGWCHSQIEFYKLIISAPCGPFDCFHNVGTMHILEGMVEDDYCKEMLQVISRERDDSVRRIMELKLKTATREGKGFFSVSKDWKTKVMYTNRKYTWPVELQNVRDYLKVQNYPHILVYSMKSKKVLMVKIEISWESRLGERRELEAEGFKVFLKHIHMGSRGVLRPDIYEFFIEICGMTYGNAYLTMENISQAIIRAAYNEYNREKNTKRPRLESYLDLRRQSRPF